MKPTKTVFEDRTEYKLNGKYHRNDGPAIDWNHGDKFWYVDGLLHRDDGPAVIYASGRRKWFRSGLEITEMELEKIPNNKTKAETQLYQLLYAVQRKFPGESRFETALRYIQNAERSDNAASCGTSSEI